MYEFLKKKKETQAERKRWRVKKKERKRKESYMTERNKYIKEAVSKVVQYSSILQKYYRVKNKNRGKKNICLREGQLCTVAERDLE